MPHRYFTKEIGGGTAALTGPDAHHLADVMRAKVGDEVVLCDAAATEYTARVTSIAPGRVEFAVSPGYPSGAEPGVAVSLFVGYPKQGKLEEIIRHAVELGVGEVIPFFSRYCVVTPKKEEAKNERYNRLAVEAAKQCGRGRLPGVALPLPDFAAVCAALPGYDLALFFYEGGGEPLRLLLNGAKTPPRRIAIITGSEGGFAPEEAALAAKAGAVTVGLGPRILRCETAPLAALAAVMVLTGNLE
ncbi:MAG: RsmE family RNA methyltransferase [Gemmiger sp.]|nr:RsmE family RNA methyltransferase [Gemmiger sp.]